LTCREIDDRKTGGSASNDCIDDAHDVERRDTAARCDPGQLCRHASDRTARRDVFVVADNRASGGRL
jgi:hypothetical protein